MSHTEYAPNPPDPTFDQIVAGYYDNDSSAVAAPPNDKPITIYNSPDIGAHRYDPYLPNNRDPRISIGLEVGKTLLPGQVMEVNYDTLRETMEQVGLDTKQNHSRLRLRLGETRSDNGSLDDIREGYYAYSGLPTDNLAEVVDARAKDGPLGDFLQDQHNKSLLSPRIGVLLRGTGRRARAATQDRLEHELTHYKQDLDRTLFAEHMNKPVGNDRNSPVWRKMAGAAAAYLKDKLLVPPLEELSFPREIEANAAAKRIKLPSTIEAHTPGGLASSLKKKFSRPR